MTVEWTNTAQNRTVWGDREDVYAKLEKGGFPECMHEDIYRFIKNPYIGSEAVVVSSHWGFSRRFDLAPDFEMSYGPNAEFVTTRPKPGTIAIGRLDVFSCEGETYHLSWHPNCTNLAKHTVTHTNNVCPVDPPEPPTHTVPLPGIMPLLAVGLAGWAISKKIRR